MSHYYIYYRVASEQVMEAHAAVKQIQFEIATQFGVDGRLLKKWNEPLLWMEVYENVSSPETFEQAVRNAEAKVDLARFLAGDGQRHWERFEDN